MTKIKWSRLSKLNTKLNEMEPQPKIFNDLINAQERERERERDLIIE